jgi:hypothetical protein
MMAHPVVLFCDIAALSRLRARFVSGRILPKRVYSFNFDEQPGTATKDDSDVLIREIGSPS